MVVIRPNSNFHILWGFSQTVVWLSVTNTKVVTIGESMPQVQAAPNGNVLPNVNLLSNQAGKLALLSVKPLVNSLGLDLALACTKSCLIKFPLRITALVTKDWYYFAFNSPSCYSVIVLGKRYSRAHQKPGKITSQLQ